MGTTSFDADLAARRWRLPIGRLPIAPLVAWAAAAGSLAAAANAFSYAPLASTTWARWDSGLYEQIARSGYTLFPCGDGTWCGDTAWFPAYPWVVRGLHLVGFPLLGTAVVVSWSFAAATLVLLWSTFLERSFRAAAVGALLYAAFAPGQIYDYTVFPQAMLAFWTLAHLWLLHRGRWLAAGACGAVAVLTYPAGALLIPVSALWMLTESEVPLADRLWRIARTAGVMVAALGVFVLDQYLETGRWDAFWLKQNSYHHRLQDPFAATAHALHPVFHASPFALTTAPALQTAIVTAVLLVVFVHAFLRLPSLDRLGLLLLLWALATWALPLAQTNVSLARSQATLLPLAVLVARLPRSLTLVFAAAAVAVAIPMEKLFLQGLLV
jgi:hypothetical protein